MTGRKQIERDGGRTPVVRSLVGASLGLQLLLAVALALLIQCHLAAGQADSSSSSSTGASSPWSSSSSSSSTGAGVPLTYDSRNCSAWSQSCIRIGIFYCNAQTDPPVIKYSQSGHCSSVTGYNAMIDWYRQRVAAKGGLAGVPVYFVSAFLSPKVPHSRREIAGLVNNTFFDGVTGRALVDFVIFPPGISWDQAMERLERAGIPAVASSSPLTSLFQCASSAAILAARPQAPCSAPSTRRFQYAHGLSNAADDYMSGWETLLKLKKVVTLGVVTDAQPAVLLSTQTDQPSQAHMMLQPLLIGVLQGARDNQFKVVYDQLVNITTQAVTNSFESDSAPLNYQRMDQTVQTLQNLQPDAVMLVTTRCKDWLQAFQRVDYMPPSIAGFMCSRRASADEGDPPTRFVVSSSQWSAHMTGTEYTETIDNSWSLFPNLVSGGGSSATDPTLNATMASSPRQFQRLWQQLTNQTVSLETGAAEPRGTDAAVLAAFTMLEGAIALSSSLDPALVNRQLQLYFQPSFFGLLTTNRYGMNQQKQIVSSQRTLQGDWAVVAPQSSANMDFVYPSPTWREREYHPHVIGRFQSEWAILALILLCALLTTLAMAVIGRHRVGHPHALAREFYLCSGTGCIIAYTSALTWTVDASVAQCHARIWLWTLAFHLALGPLLAATFRMARLDYQRKHATAKNGGGDLSGAAGQRFSSKKNKRIILGISIYLCLPQLLLNLLWTAAFGGLTIELQQPDDLRAVENYTQCVSATVAGESMNILTLVYSASLLAASLVCAWRIRKSMVANLFQDSRPIALATAFFALTAMIVLAVYLSLVGRSHTAVGQSVLLALLNFGMLIAYQTAFGVLVFRRLLTIWNAPAARHKTAPADAVVVGPKGGAVGPIDSVAMTPLQQAQMKIALPSHALRSPASIVPIDQQPTPKSHHPGGTAVTNGQTDVVEILADGQQGDEGGGGGAPFGVFSRLVSEPPEPPMNHHAPAQLKSALSPTAPLAPGDQQSPDVNRHILARSNGLAPLSSGGPPPRHAATTSLSTDSVEDMVDGDPPNLPAILPSRAVLLSLTPSEMATWRDQVEHHASEIEQLVSMQTEVQRADARLKYKTT